MKKVLSICIAFIMSFIAISGVSAATKNLSDVASIIAGVIGGSEKEITAIDTANTYKYYYKYVELDKDDFNEYVKSKYIVDNVSSENSDEYVGASVAVSEFESEFNNKIADPAVADLQSWTASTDGQINLSELKYQEGTHNGYLLAVAATKDGDTSTVYMSKIILESKSGSTLGVIEYTEADKTSLDSVGDTEDYDTEDETTVSKDSSSAASTNPNTGISDYAIYLVPLAIILGSGLLLRKSYS